MTDLPDVVYLASSGEYSDYRVNAAFAHQADAERYVDTLGGKVEPYRLNRALPPTARTLYEIGGAVHVLWKPAMRGTPPQVEVGGLSGHVYRKEVFPGVDGPEGDRPVITVRRTAEYPNSIRTLVGRVDVSGYVETTVKQACSEAIAGLVAEGEAMLAAGRPPADA